MASLVSFRTEAHFLQALTSKFPLTRTHSRPEKCTSCYFRPDPTPPHPSKASSKQQPITVRAVLAYGGNRDILARDLDTPSMRKVGQDSHIPSTLSSVMGESQGAQVKVKSPRRGMNSDYIILHKVAVKMG
jgi:hypothetical protein